MSGCPVGGCPHSRELIMHIESATPRPARDEASLTPDARAERFVLEGAAVLEAIRELHREAGRMSKVRVEDVAIVVAAVRNLSSEALRARPSKQPPVPEGPKLDGRLENE